MSDNPLSSKVGLDTTEFKTGISGLNRDLRVLESGFRASAAQLGDWSRTSEGLEMRMQALSAEMDIQRQKVDRTRAEYERLAETKGENSRAAEDMLIRLNREVEALNRMESEMRQNETALQTMGDESKATGAKVEDLGEKTQESGSKMSGFKAAIGDIGKLAKGTATAVAAVGTAALAAAAGLAGMALKAAYAADDLVDLSTKTGIGVERLQEMGYIGDQVGTDLNTMTGSMSRLIRSMDKAATQQKEYDDQLAEGVMEDEITTPIDMAAAFNQLGVSVTDANGQLRDSEDVFLDAIDALGKVTNETERDALGMQIFGKTAQELNPLIEAGKGKLAQYAAQARTTGAVMSEDAVRAAAELADQVDGLKRSFTGISGTLLGLVIPGFKALATTAGGYMKRLADVVKASNGDTGRLLAGVGGILTDIVQQITAELPKLMQVGVGILQGLTTAILSALPTLIPAVVAIITSLVGFITQNLPLLMNAGVQILMALINGILPMLPALIDAGLQVLINLVQGITQAIPTLIPTIVQVVLQIVQTLVENLPLLVDAALQLIIALASGLVAALPVLVQMLPQIMEAIVSSLMTSLPLIINAAGQLITTLVGGIISNLPKLVGAGLKILRSFVEGATSLPAELITIGMNIVEGVWQGIQANAGKFIEDVKGFFLSIVTEVKDALLINSPSRLMIPIGAAIPEGFARGVKDNLAAAQREINSAMSGLTMNMAPGLAGLASVSSEVNNNQSFQTYYAPVYYVNGNGGQGDGQNRRRW